MVAYLKQCLKLNKYMKKQINEERKNKKDNRMLLAIEQDFDFSMEITVFKYVMQMTFDDSEKFIMDMWFGLTCRNRLRVNH
jgi:hypothetical protein